MSQCSTARQKRAAHPEFARTFGYAALTAKLPLRLPVELDVKPSPKSAYRSCYGYLGHTDLADEALRSRLSDFEISLRLIDLANLRDELASRLYQPSDRGQDPFDLRA